MQCSEDDVKRRGKWFNDDRLGRVYLQLPSAAVKRVGPDPPKSIFFWYGAYARCPKTQTYHFCIVMRYVEVQQLVYYQFT